jgi:hypothetical protein
MSNFDNFFNEDPWAEISGPIFPMGRQLYVKDQRFWVSINDNGEYVFFVHEEGLHEINEVKDLSDLDVQVEFPGKGTMLIYTLKDEILKDKFSTIIKSVAHNTSGFNGKKLLEEVSKEVLSWADFLRPSRRGLTRSELIGLWGELYILSEILTQTYSIDDSVRFWIGPEGKKQDFTLNNLAIETKTTLSGDGDSIRISSLDQLNKITEELFLMHVFINLSDSSSGNCLKNMYEDLLKKIGDDTHLKNIFEVKISTLYGKATIDQLDERFDFIKYDLYQVSEDFPKITFENTSVAITRARYSINTAALLPFKVEQELSELLDE